MSNDMNPNRFAALAEAYGGDIRRWPDAERDAAWAFLKAQPESAAPALAAARRIDTALDSIASFQPSAALRDLVLASAPRSAARAASAWWTARWLAPGAGFAAACAAGAWLGLVAAHGAQTQLKADSVMVASADLSAGDLEDPGAL
jgi:hypothetical protein